MVSHLESNPDDAGARRLGHEFLDVIRRRPTLRRLSRDSTWEVRLLALFRYWNVIDTLFPYKYAIEGGWAGVLDLFVPQLLFRWLIPRMW